MRLKNPNTDAPHREKAIETATEIFEYDDPEDTAKLFVDYIIKMEEETGYVPATRQKAIGAGELLMSSGESYWVNLVAVATDITDEEYDAVLKTCYDWHNWE